MQYYTKTENVEEEKMEKIPEKLNYLNAFKIAQLEIL